jgi:hypothetical protein
MVELTELLDDCIDSDVLTGSNIGHRLLTLRTGLVRGDTNLPFILKLQHCQIINCFHLKSQAYRKVRQLLKVATFLSQAACSDG